MGFPQIDNPIKCLSGVLRAAADHRGKQQIILYFWPAYTLGYRGCICAVSGEKKKASLYSSNTHLNTAYIIVSISVPPG